MAGAQDAAERRADGGAPPKKTPSAPLDPAAYVARRMAEGQSKKEAMREAARTLGLSRRAVYQALLREGSEWVNSVTPGA